MPYKFDLEEFDKKLLEKLAPRKPVTSLAQRLKGLARLRKLPKIKRGI